MTTSTALLFSVPIAFGFVDAIFGQVNSGNPMEAWKDIGVVGALTVAVVALWQDRERDRTNRDKDRESLTKLVGELSSHIATSNEVQRQTANQITELTQIIQQMDR